MKIAFTTLCVCFLILTACNALAGDSTVIANFPAPSGSYNKVMLQNLQQEPNCSTFVAGAYVNAGVLFMHTDSVTHTQTLELCTNDGSAQVVPYPETCFNRFCAAPNSSGCSFSGNNGCPPNFTQATKNGSTPLVDTFQTSTNYWVSSTVCCSCTYQAGKCVIYAP